MEMTMAALLDSQLKTFNTLALHYQDDAYTLAYYLLGDEGRAIEATQAAFAYLYKRSGLRLDQFRLEMLRWVMNNCRQGGGVFTRAMAKDVLCRQLHDLRPDERSAVILVDMLELEYEDAAQVLNCTRKQVTHLIAQARVQLSQAIEPVQ